MTREEQLQQVPGAHLESTQERPPGARWYALDEAGLDSLAQFGIAWQEDRAERGENFDLSAFNDVIAQLVEQVPSLMQVRPEQSANLPAKVWKDAITGQVARNPWSEPVDLESQGAVTEADPALAKHLKATAEGVSYKLLSEQRKAEAARARIAAIKCSEPEHKTNPFVTGDVQGQSKLVRDNPELAHYYKGESKAATLPWQPGQNNLTAIGALTRKAPQLAKIANRAAEFQRQVLADELSRAKAAEASAQRARQKAEALLQTR